MQAIVFLLDAVISFFCVLFLLRFMMQAMRVSFAGQPRQFRRRPHQLGGQTLAPHHSRHRRLDWSTVFAAFALQLLLAGILIALPDPFCEADGLSLVPMILWFALRGRAPPGRLHHDRRADPASRAVVDQSLLAAGRPGPATHPADARPDPPPHPADFRHRSLAAGRHPAPASGPDVPVSDWLRVAADGRITLTLHIQPGAKKPNSPGCMAMP
jgi:hypothetical protein